MYSLFGLISQLYDSVVENGVVTIPFRSFCKPLLFPVRHKNIICQSIMHSVNLLRDLLIVKCWFIADLQCCFEESLLYIIISFFIEIIVATWLGGITCIL